MENNQLKTRMVGSKKETSSWWKSLLSIAIIILVAGTGRWFAHGDLWPFYVPNKDSETIKYFTDTNSWKEYNSVEGNFKVSLPTFPKHESGTVTIPGSDLTGTVDLYQSSKGDDSYFIQAIRYNGEIDVSNPNTALEGGFNGRVAEIPNHKIISSNFGSFISNNSLDYLVQSDNYYIYGKLVLFGNKVYLLEMQCEIQKCSKVDYQKFIGSFQLQ